MSALKPARKNKIPDLLKNIALFLFSIIFSLSILEIAYRAVYEHRRPAEKPKENWAIIPERFWTEYHPVLGWFHQKNKKAFFRKNGSETELNTNSQGLRGQRDYQTEKAAGIKRIVALGDSFFFGWGVKDEETFASKLEARHKNLEVINLGVPGYGMDQILLMFTHIGQAYHPDVVLIGIYPEDFWRATRAFSDSGYAKPYFVLSDGKQLILKNMPVPKPFELNTNQFPEIMKRNPVENILIYSSIYRSLKDGFIRLGKNLKWIDPDSTEEWVLGRAILSELVREVRASQATPILVIVPPSRWMESERRESVYLSLLRFAKRESIEVIDPVPVFREAVKKSGVTKYYIQDDWHWTQEGHELIAGLLSERLKKYGLTE